MSKQVVTRTPEQVFDLWLKSLRSGNYRQTYGQLRYVREDKNGKRRGTYCCLGVLCDLARKDGGPRWQNGIWGASFSGESAYLPPVMAEYLGITEEMQETLAKMNDDRVSFVKIANYIEHKVKPKALARLSEKKT